MSSFKKKMLDMSLQEIFNKVYLGLASQGFRQSLNPNVDPIKNPDMICLYRGPDGLKCGVGHLIDDKDYKPTMEGKGIITPAFMGTQYDAPGSLTRERTDLLGDIQMVHDKMNAATSMQFRLRGLAALYNLTVPEIPDATPSA